MIVFFVLFAKISVDMEHLKKKKVFHGEIYYINHCYLWAL